MLAASKKVCGEKTRAKKEEGVQGLTLRERLIFERRRRGVLFGAQHCGSQAPVFGICKKIVRNPGCWYSLEMRQSRRPERPIMWLIDDRHKHEAGNTFCSNPHLFQALDVAQPKPSTPNSKL